MLLTRRFAGIVTIALLSFGQLSAFASDEPDLHPVNEQLAKEILKYGIRSVFVVDFLSPKGEPSALGWWVADQLSENWFHEAPKFRVADRADRDKTTITLQDIENSQRIKQLGFLWGVDAIITGTIEELPEHYRFVVTVRRVLDNSVAFTVSGHLPHSRILDLVRPMDWSDINRAGFNGTGVPQCIHCVPPGYTDRARMVKAHGSIVLAALISTEGRAENIRIIRGLGYGLTENAIKSVSDWQFTPVSNAEGVRVPATMNLEVKLNIN